MIVLSSCSTKTKIKDIYSHPRDYINKEVTVRGTVTEKFSLAFVKYFQIADSTDSIYVISSKPFPATREEIEITGIVDYYSLGTYEILTII